MIEKRLIPMLLMEDELLYKTERFKNSNYIGDVINAFKMFNDYEVDEIALLSYRDSLNNQEIQFNFLKEILSEAFMPVSYGGAVSTIQDCEKLFYLGVEKIVINSAAYYQKNLITEIANEFGSQAITISVDYKKSILGNRIFYVKSGTIKTEYNAVDFAREAIEKGAGEIIFQSIDKDGTFNGVDTDFIRKIKLNVPTVFAGGSSNYGDTSYLFSENKHLKALGSGSLFVYNGTRESIIINYPTIEDKSKILTY
jgi:imidazole glycerol-phosphate synthase subunit HisF